MINRELIYPKELDAIVPLWLNHFLVSHQSSLMYLNWLDQLYFVSTRSLECLFCWRP